MPEDIVYLTLHGITACVTSLLAHVDAISPDEYQALAHLYDRIHDIQKAVVCGTTIAPVVADEEETHDTSRAYR